MRAPFSFLKAAAGGGGVPAWFDQLSDPTLATTTGDPSNFARHGKVTPSASGSCTKLRIYISGTNAGAYDLKMSLHATGGTLLAAGIVVGTSADTTDRYFEVPLTTPYTVTSGTEYRIGWRASNTSWGQHLSLTGQPAGSGYTSTLTYANIDTDPATFSSTTSIYPVGMYIT